MDEKTPFDFKALSETHTPESIASDLAMVRVVEDLIELLISKSVITLNELPPPVQQKLLARHKMRREGVFEFKNSDLIKL